MYGFGTPRYAGYVDFGQFAGEVRIFAASFTCVLIPRRAWELVGPLDERYGYYYEDVDWSIRARMGGMEIHAAPSSHRLPRGLGVGGRGPTRPPSARWSPATGCSAWPRCCACATSSGSAGATYARTWSTCARRCAERRSTTMARAIGGALVGAAVRLPSVYRARAPLERWHLMPDEDIFRLAARGPAADGGRRPAAPDLRRDSRALRAAARPSLEQPLSSAGRAPGSRAGSRRRAARAAFRCARGCGTSAGARRRSACRCARGCAA